MASMKALVPDLAIVPKLLMSSFFVMPTPGYSIIRVDFVLSRTILMYKFGRASIFSGSVTDSFGMLSSASDAFESNSRRKIALLE